MVTTNKNSVALAGEFATLSRLALYNYDAATPGIVCLRRQQRKLVTLASCRPSREITSGLPVILPQRATANRERQGALTESRTTIAGVLFYREWLCGAGQGCRGRILERLHIDNCLPLTVELFRQLAFFILSCKPISYCRSKRIDVYIL